MGHEDTRSQLPGGILEDFVHADIGDGQDGLPRCAPNRPEMLDGAQNDDRFERNDIGDTYAGGLALIRTMAQGSATAGGLDASGIDALEELADHPFGDLIVGGGWLALAEGKYLSSSEIGT